MITGKTLIDMGFTPGAWFKGAIEHGNAMLDQGHSMNDVALALAEMQPAPLIPLRRTAETPAFSDFLPRGDTKIEQDNYDMVVEAMRKIMHIPTVESAAIMPDACPAGTIPVGGVVGAKDAIHPGYHSADVCCSMMISVIQGQHDPKKLMDTLHSLVHFGPTKRKKRPAEVSLSFIEAMPSNPFLKGLEGVAVEHFTTQGDGNHFYYVGHLESTGELAIVSHHGSRGLGAQVYKRGLAAAHRETNKIAEGVPKAHAWFDMNTQIGQDYWSALSAVRAWTYYNHYAVHDLAVGTLGGRVSDRFWNPHNFVFERDGIWYHAKGATPSYNGHSFDDAGRSIIPMNMAHPILITEHRDNKHALGFAPHGAGRNMSRTKFLKESSPSIPKDIDVRFWCGEPDPSELPEAYKTPAAVIDEIERFNLAKVVDRVLPYGSIMAGDWEKNAPWKKGR